MRLDFEKKETQKGLVPSPLLRTWSLFFVFSKPVILLFWVEIISYDS